MLNIKNTTDGFLKDVEIKGNTIQDINQTGDLADIRSVGDKVEGQELYKIPVLSCGKNLFNKVFKDALNNINGVTVNDSGVVTINGTFSTHAKFNVVIPKGEYRATTFSDSIAALHVFWYGGDTYFQQNKVLSYTEDTTIQCYIAKGTYDNHICKFQLEEGTQATPYEPCQEDKLTILSPVQLEKVGNVADRIICKDGVWGVEKNISNIYPTFGYNTIYSGFYLYYYTLNDIIDTSVGNKIYYISNRNVVTFTDRFKNLEEGNTYVTPTKWVYVATQMEKSDFENTYNGKVLVKYPTTQPQFIPLPHDQQVKLRTFAGQTNIHFETEIEGTLKAQVPKSLGATVNTHTEQIGNLSKELDRVKKLEESTVSTIVSKSDFTTVEETANGYFEDVKLEGKTLVNVLSPKYHSVGAAWGTDEKTFILDIVSGFGQPMILGKFNQGLKRDTKYTAIVNVSSYTHGIPHFCFMNKENNKATSQELTLMSSGLHKLVFTTNADSDSYYFRILPRNGVDNKYSIDRNIIILEGDHTQNPPEYFEGLMSVGQDVEEVSVLSTGINAIDLNSVECENGFTVKTIDDNILTFKTSASDYVYVKCLLGKDVEYTLNMNINTNPQNIRLIDSDKKTTLKVFSMGANMNEKFNVNKTGYYYLRFNTDSNIEYIVKNLSMYKKDMSLDYRKDKKRLLYYNPTTQTWEKPILRQWDSIEKHSDGKYYYHKRSGEVVLNGGESWRFYSDTNSIVNISFEYVVDDKYNNPSTKASNLINDKFEVKDADTVYAQDVEGIVDRLNLIRVKINRSKLSTQDAAGFKQWLQANPTTVVYQLAQEEVYECTNIDLITYDGETNYIVNCGAIAPKSILKVHNNISNVVKILQEKVSLLESNVKASQEVQDMMILETDMRMLDIELALMEHMPMKLNLGENIMLRSATYFNFIKGHIVNETYSKDYLENVMNKYLATNRLTQEEYDELYKLLYPQNYDIALPIEE